MANSCHCSRLRQDDTDAMACALADRIIETTVSKDVERGIVTAVSDILAKRRRPRRRVDFDSYYRFLAPFEGKMKRTMKKYWGAQVRVIVNNMRRTPSPARAISGAASKGITFAELFEQWAFAKGPADKALQVVYKDFADKLLYATAAREASAWGLSVNWNVFNPNIAKWVNGYSIDLADEINATTLDRLKNSLYEGWEAGESIPDLTHRVRDLYEEFDRARAEMIARSETIRGSNQGALETYRASGVVDRVMWLATPSERTCEICDALDGKTVVLDDAFFDDDYGDGTAPPAHPNCRCTIVPVLEGED